MDAIVRIAGHQYAVKPNDVIVVDKLDAEVGKTVDFPDVLFPQNKKKVVVKAKVIAHEKGEKIEVRRFKSKVRHRRHTGFRPQQTKLEITAIS